MIQFFQPLYHSIIDLLYPPRCIHCGETALERQTPFCRLCTESLQLIDPKERCPCCFSLEYDPENSRCFICKPNESLLQKTAAVFDYVGPAASMIRQLKYGQQTYLAKGAGAFMAAQLIQLEWPIPDVIVPVPLSWMHWLDRGYNQSLLLAESMGKILHVPVEDILIRKSGDYSQAGMNQKQRKGFSGNTLSLKKGVNFTDKRILLVDDVATTGATLRCCAELLYETFPLEIYALTFCKALKD